MSLYWFVDTKDQILELMVDRIFLGQPPSAGDEWRARRDAIGRATLALPGAPPPGVEDYLRDALVAGGLERLRSLERDERFTDERFDRQLGFVLDGIASGLVAR